MTDEERHALNLRMAVEVMEIRVLNIPDLNHRPGYPHIVASNGWLTIFLRPQINGIPWSPCADFNQAMQCVEKMRQRTVSISIDSFMGRYDVYCRTCKAEASCQFPDLSQTICAVIGKTLDAGK